MEDRKLKRDIIPSLTDKGELVGIYWADNDGSSVIVECTPEIADRIVKVWNTKGLEGGKK